MELIVFRSFFAIIFFAGLLLYVGTTRKWSFIIDPPFRFWLMFGNSFYCIKKALGAERFVIFNKILAVSIMAASTAMLIASFV